MSRYLTNKRILLGVTGSIAAYKSADLVRRLREAGAVVRVAMTENAKQFITPLTLQAVSGHPVHETLFDVEAEAAMGHIELARWADAVVIAPASAGFMARLSQGQADDLLTTLCLVTRAPIAVAPAMNQGMWQHTLTQENAQALRAKGIVVLGPAEGSQACGDRGPGRMLEPAEIADQVGALFASGALAGVNVMVTAGPTHEAIDPIRYITNASSGKMGYALARAAREAGANVTLISGPVSLPRPHGMDCVEVVSAQEMHDAVMRNITGCDIFLAVAAVGDYRCKTVSARKIHKSDAAIELALERNPDIAASVGAMSKRPFLVGFAAETDHVIASAKDKRNRKQMDMIVANCVGQGEGMGSDENEVIVINDAGETPLPRARKDLLARQLVTMIAAQYKKKRRP